MKTRKLIEAVQVAHKETNRIHQMMQIRREWRLRRKSRNWKKLREAKAFIIEIQNASSVDVLLFIVFKVIIESLRKVQSLPHSEKELSPWFCGSKFGVKQGRSPDPLLSSPSSTPVSAFKRKTVLSIL